MFDWLSALLARCGRPLLLHYPELWLMRVHVVIPSVLVAIFLAWISAAAGSVSRQDVPNVEDHLYTLLVGAGAVGGWWGFLVARDSFTAPPLRGWKRIGVFAGYVSTGFALLSPPFVHALTLAEQVMAVCSGEFCRREYLVDNARRLLNDGFPVDVGGFSLMLLILLAVVVLAREVGVKIALITVAMVAIYGAVWGVLLAVARAGSATTEVFGMVGLLHVLLLALILGLQWARGGCTRFSRAVGCLWALIIPLCGVFLGLAGHQTRNADLPAIAIMSYTIYSVALPITHGNLVRLRQLPAA